MSKRKGSKIRKGIQLLILGAILVFFILQQVGWKEVDFESYCPMGGIQSILTLMQDGIIACNMTFTQMVMGVLFIVMIFILGKLYCSYLCPIGTVSEWIGRIGDKYNLRRDINGVPDKLLRALKYVLLFFTITITLKTGELFCKQYDPFYASITMFGHRVNYLFATISILLMVLGSLMYRLFWCKYLCPLGAISNIFKYWIGVVSVMLILITVYFFELGVDISYVVAVICIVGYVVEIYRLKTTVKSVLKITRHTNICIDCGLCSRTCPQGIDVADLSVVKHPDCNICGDCVSSCPKPGALTFNDKLKMQWLPAVIVIALFFTGVILGSLYDLPTVSKQWGSQDEINNSKTVRIDHLSHLKCFSSSMGFVRQMKEVKGITGVDTYIKDRTAIISYDTTKLKAVQIRKMLYARSKQFVQKPKLDEDLVVYKLRLSKYIDKEDLKDMAKGLKDKGIYQLETQFDTEIRLLAFCSPKLSENQVKDLFHSVDDGKFKVAHITTSSVPINGKGLMKRTFKNYKATFNKYKSFNKEEIGVVQFDVLEFPKNEQMFQLLANHLGKRYLTTVAMVARYDEKATLSIYYVKNTIEPALINEWINQPELSLVYTTGEKENVINPFKFNKITE
ncbi:4Fe-4S binding protein [Halosquirtibacter xylanolyticus]|uniref:4Fe-4S binding protein n=1 Tax=Halosquirtibacter xylanolyticus TaxID=3374599 RepID=UPI0037486BD0|nr:4Fe-4S binding protein [Prolixibacteraceae bacterium]